jgi:hypothetical protein
MVSSEIIISAILASLFGSIHVVKKDNNQIIINKLDEIHKLLIIINNKQSDLLSDDTNNNLSDDTNNNLSDDTNNNLLDDTNNNLLDEINDKQSNESLLVSSDKINEIKTSNKSNKKVKQIKHKQDIIDLTDEKIIEVKRDKFNDKYINEFIELISDASIDTGINKHELINLKKNILTKIKLANKEIKH